MTTRTLKRREALNIICRKTAFGFAQVEKLTLNSGKISYPYFKQLIELIRNLVGRSHFSMNGNEWEYVDRRLKQSDLSATSFVDFFCLGAKESALLKAKIMKPKTSRNFVKQFIADCLEVETQSLSEDTRINMLISQKFQYDYNFYWTLIGWCQERFLSSPPDNLVENGTLKELISFYADD